MPSYLAGFRCIGPECEDHCCYGWDITVDRRTTERYRQLKPAGLGKRIRKTVRPNRRNRSDSRYARILRKGDKCPFLTPDRLCRIHAELGEEYLPDACALFPRRLRAKKGRIDVSASMACPEIARLALGPPGGIELVESPLEPQAPGIRSVEPAAPREIEEAGVVLRDAALSILKDRKHDLWQRLLTLGYLLERVAVQGPEGTLHLVEEFTCLVDAGGLTGLIESGPVMSGLQLQLVRRLHDELMPAVKTEVFKNCARDCFAGLGYESAQVFDDSVLRRYDSAHDLFYLPFLEHSGFMLENYLVNYLLHHDFCLRQGRALYDNFVLMVVNFAMLKTYMIGMAARHGDDFDAGMVTRLVYSFTKTVEPNDGFRDYALGLLAESGCTDMTHLAVLLRN